MSPAEAWVRTRLAGAPPALLEAMLAALPPGSTRAVPDALAEAARSLYAELEGVARADALPLLAADALATHALEAQAEADPEGIAALAERMAAGSGRAAG